MPGEEKVARKENFFILEKIKTHCERILRNSTTWKVEESLKYFAFVSYFSHLVKNILGSELWGFCKALS